MRELLIKFGRGFQYVLGLRLITGAPDGGRNVHKRLVSAYAGPLANVLGEANAKIILRKI